MMRRVQKALVPVTCPLCYGQTKAEPGKRAICPFCGKEFDYDDLQSAFAPDVQFALPADGLLAQQNAGTMQPQRDLQEMAANNKLIWRGMVVAWTGLLLALMIADAFGFRYAVPLWIIAGLVGDGVLTGLRDERWWLPGHAVPRNKLILYLLLLFPMIATAVIGMLVFEISHLL